MNVDSGWWRLWWVGVGWCALLCVCVLVWLSLGLGWSQILWHSILGQVSRTPKSKLLSLLGANPYMAPSLSKARGKPGFSHKDPAVPLKDPNSLPCAFYLVSSTTGIVQSTQPKLQPQNELSQSEGFFKCVHGLFTFYSRAFHVCSRLFHVVFMLHLVETILLRVLELHRQTYRDPAGGLNTVNHW